jgi:hypothetical protein
MPRIRLLFAMTACFCLAGLVVAQEPAVPVTTAHGMVEKADKDTLKVRLRGADGKFGKMMALKVTGTTKISTVTLQKRAGKAVPVQRDTDVKDLLPHQAITIIYVTAPSGEVLLSAVVQPAPDK